MRWEVIGGRLMTGNVWQMDYGNGAEWGGGGPPRNGLS